MPMSEQDNKNRDRKVKPESAEIQLAIYSQDDTLRAVLSENGQPVEYLQEVQPGQVCRQDIYVGKIIRAVKALDAVFIDIGAEKDAMLPLAQCGATTSPGTPLIVQVRQVKSGDKGHLLTRNFQLPGPFAVYLPDSRPRRRSKLQALPAEQREQLFQNDLDRLKTMWHNLCLAAGAGQVPRLLASFSQVIDLALISYTGVGLKTIHVQGQATYAQVYARMQEILPQFLHLLRLHVAQDYTLPELLGLGNIDRERQRRQVFLRRGGSLTIDSTEALTVIDVDSGSTGGDSPADMRLRVNLEAAGEIVRQLRLRNMAGIIIIDFIDMSSGDEQVLLANMRQLLRRDRGHSRLFGFTRLGLLEMTRTPV